MADRDGRLVRLAEELAAVERAGQAELLRKEEELQQLSRQLQEREAELHELEGCEDAVIEIAASS